MEALRSTYDSEESFRDDWVAGQQQLLRDIFSHVKAELSGKYPAKTFFISGGISRNPAFDSLPDWLRVPDHVAGDDGGGCFMAYLGYHVKEKGLVIKHDRWKDCIYSC
jgi:hypothetical protein